jgi:hypothetical protein
MASLPDAHGLLRSYFGLAHNGLRTEEDMPATSSCRILIVAVVVAAAASLASSAYAGSRVSSGTLSAVQKTALEISPGSLAASASASTARGIDVSLHSLTPLQKTALEISPGSLAASASASASTERGTDISLPSLTPLQIAALEISPGSLGTVVVPATVVPPEDGFRWDDAGLGAAAILLLTAAFATAVTIGRRRSQRLLAR